MKNMDALPLHETDFIVLRIQQYGERDVIVNGISPDCGRLGLMVKGGAGGMKRAFPEVGMFRMLRIAFRETGGELQRLEEVREILGDFGGVSGDYEKFTAANWLGAFSLMNIMPMLPHPHFFNAAGVALGRLAACEQLPVEAVLAGACLAFVFEEGWLASVMEDRDSASRCRRLLEMAAGLPAPVLSNECWNRQFEWVRGILLSNDCRLPG